jgi:hypothetical protein
VVRYSYRSFNHASLPVRAISESPIEHARGTSAVPNGTLIRCELILLGGPLYQRHFDQRHYAAPSNSSPELAAWRRTGCPIFFINARSPRDSSFQASALALLRLLYKIFFIPVVERPFGWESIPSRCLVRMLLC